MKALSYLQKVGAVPEYEKWDLLMALVTLVEEEFFPETCMEPDIIEWVQTSNSEEEFESKCNAILFATSGDVRAMFPHVCNQSTAFIKELIENLLEIRVMLHCLSEGQEYTFSDEVLFVNNCNEIFGLRGKKRFLSKNSILQFYFSGNLVESGQDILSEYAGTQSEFLEQIANIHADFLTLAKEQFNLKVGKIKFESEKDNPFEGGYQAKVTVEIPDTPEQECTLHWAPWPSAKTNSQVQIIQELCCSFSERERAKWFFVLHSGKG